MHSSPGKVRTQKCVVNVAEHLGSETISHMQNEASTHFSFSVFNIEISFICKLLERGFFPTKDNGKSLRPDTFVHDVIIQWYLNAATSGAHDSDVLVVDTQWWPIIVDNVAKKKSGGVVSPNDVQFPDDLHTMVRRYLVRTGLGRQSKKIAIPINENPNHWSCASANVDTHQIDVFCSLERENMVKIVQECCQTLFNELAKFKGYSHLAGQWTCVLKNRVPVQTDGSSCGLFVCAYMEFIVRGKTLSRDAFSQINIDHLRSSLYKFLSAINTLTSRGKQ